MLTQARSFALQAHGNQMYGNKPYSFHLDMVADIVMPYGEQAQIVAYLHDVVEDTSVSKEQLKETFGDFVADCVGLLTDEPGANRKERKAKTYQKLSLVEGPTELALIVKAADRLANVKACIADNKQTLLQVYSNEHATFKAAAYRTGLCDPIWAELDHLFKDIAPELANSNQ